MALGETRFNTTPHRRPSLSQIVTPEIYCSSPFSLSLSLFFPRFVFYDSICCCSDGGKRAQRGERERKKGGTPGRRRKTDGCLRGPTKQGSLISNEVCMGIWAWRFVFFCYSFPAHDLEKITRGIVLDIPPRVQHT